MKKTLLWVFPPADYGLYTGPATDTDATEKHTARQTMPPVNSVRVKVKVRSHALLC